MSRQNTAREIGERIRLEQMQYLALKWKDFKDGDPDAAFTEEEQDCLTESCRLELESDVSDAEVSYLKGLSDEQLEDMLRTVQASVDRGQGLN